MTSVVIVGDSGDGSRPRNELVPTWYQASTVNLKYGSSPEIASDNRYVDIDLDGLPDLQLGRITADNKQQLSEYLQRAIQYETQDRSGPWIRQINCVAGVGGFGPLIDGLIEQTTKQILTDLIPGGYQTSMTYGSWTSPYCPDPRRFSDEAIERFNEGCLFWVYIGHGHRDRLDKVRMPDKPYPILDLETVDKINCRRGSPIAIFLACYTGACDYRKDCLVEQMVSQKNGPIAAICGTRVTMPYAMSLMSLELVHEYFHGKSETLGELFLKTKRQMAVGSENYPRYRQMIDGMGTSLSPNRNLLDREKMEHVQMIHLIGDPLLRLKRPQNIEVTIPKSVVAGKSLTVMCQAPFDGKLTVELAYQRDRLKKRMKRRKEYHPDDDSLNQYQAIYSAARDLVVAKKTVPVSAGTVALNLNSPGSASGPCVVRAMLESGSEFAIGSEFVTVKRK
ncbi:MAG: C25 family cysteine peptidase [Planctomycetota bacterium]